MYKKTGISIILTLVMFASLMAQGGHSHTIKDNKTFVRGGFGEIHLHRDLDKGKDKALNLEIPNFAMRLGYVFNDKWHFFGKLALEHGHEIHLENLYLNYEVSHELNIKGGLITLPVGIVNQEHLPTTYNGVTPPQLYRYIIPMEWCELGFGVNGEHHESHIAYQAYLVNGLVSYHDGGGLFDGFTGFRSGRQSGHDVRSALPSFAGRIEWHGIKNGVLGASLYAGKSQSDAYSRLSSAAADSTVIGLVMLGADARLSFGGLQFRGEVMYNRLSNVSAYNSYTNTDIGQSMLGWYGELAYKYTSRARQFAVQPFVRYARYDTHLSVPQNTKRNGSYANNTLTCGLGFFINNHVMLKTDYQHQKYDDGYRNNTLNGGVSFVW